jgi:phage anti-repressor protein
MSSVLEVVYLNIIMYGKIPERKLKERDYLFSCEEARKELDEYLDNENRRVNVDSAKKMAVIQRTTSLMQTWTTKDFVKWF